MPEFQNKPNHTITDEDGNNHWISRSLAVVVTVILNGEKVLLVKRGEGISSPGKWCNPCGYLDWNESAIDCIYREVWEETGLDLSKIDSEKIIKNDLQYPWDIVTDPSLNHNQDIALYYGISLKMEKEPILSSENCDDGESDDVRWVDINDIWRYEFAFNHDKRINKFLNYLNK